MNRRDASPPTTGFSVPTTPTDPTGTSYPFSFQSLAEPYSPSCSNATPFIPFSFIPLWTLSLTTDGYAPSPKKSPACPVYPDLRGERSRGVPSFQGITHISRPRDSARSEQFFTDHESRVRQRSASAKSTHELRTFAQQLLCLPYLRISWGRGRMTHSNQTPQTLPIAMGMHGIFSRAGARHSSLATRRFPACKPRHRRRSSSPLQHTSHGASFLANVAHAKDSRGIRDPRHPRDVAHFF